MRRHLLALSVVVPVFTACLGLGASSSAQTSESGSLSKVSKPTNSFDYREVDRYALAAPKEAQQSLATLAAYLSQAGNSAREKARAIFIWVTNNISYDLDSVATGKWEQRPEFVLQLRCTDCLGRAQLFEKLAQSAGLEAVVIKGSTKTFEVSPTHGMKYAKATANGVIYDSHAWNAVKLGGKWELIDVTFAGGKVKQNGKLGQGSSVDPYYFLVPPKELIYRHFPNDPKWQLLETPVFHSQHEQMPLLSVGFFKHKMGSLSQKEGTIQADSSLVMTMTAPNGVAMYAELRQSGAKVEGQRTFSQRGAKNYEFHAVMPKAGTYLLRIFARPVSQSQGQWDFIADYKVEAKSGKPESSLPFASDDFQTNGGYVFTPASGSLEAGKPQRFEVSFPNAISVGVLTGRRIFPLEKRGNAFSGYVTLVPGEVLITARFPARPDWNAGMVRYNAR